MPEFSKHREERLQTARKTVEKIYTDYGESGKEHVGIDHELKDGITTLLAMGLQTESSCWGHPERRDDPSVLYAEKNLFPYITFSGFQPNDGLDEHGNPQGYSRAQVDAACARMKIDAATLRSLLDAFYGQRPAAGPQNIQLQYPEDMPAARLVTRDADRLEEVDRNEQDVAIRQAHDEWKAFLDFMQTAYMRGD